MPRRIAGFLQMLSGLLAPNAIPRARGGGLMTASGLTDDGTTLTAASRALTVGGVVTVTGNNAIVPAAVSGTPAQHGLFQENVVKGWLKAGVAADITASFNATALTDAGAGQLTVTWARSFVNSTYVVVVALQTD